MAMSDGLRKRSDGAVDRRSSAGEATREKILNAAETLFAERGQEGASVRLIAEAAAVDLAMINYHFGSKEDLYHAVFRRRAEGLNALRLAELAVAMRSSRGRPKLSRIVYAMAAPNVRLRHTPELGGINFARIIVREMIEPSVRARANIEENFGMLAEQFIAALAKVFPKAAKVDLVWAFHFAICTLVQAMVSNARVAELLGDDQAANDAEEALDRLVPFIESGIRTAVAGRERRQPRTDRPEA